MNCALADDSAEDAELPVVASEDFESGVENWEFLDPKSWDISEHDGDHTLNQHVKAASYHPPHRSPHHIALLKGPIVSDFELTVHVHSTHEDYGHRDVCLFFGYQDDEHFYYVHLGKEMDSNANQIFIVNEAARKKISLTTTDGTPWTDHWHTVKVVRKADEGAIEVYFDNMQEPVMTAKDENFTWGRVGLGSFDDTAEFDDLVLRGVVPSPPVDHVLPETQPTQRY